MKQTFKGRAVLSGAIDGYALVTHQGFNTYASFYESIHEKTQKAVCADSGNPELYGKNMINRILCLPRTTGSTSSGGVWQCLAKWGAAPNAVLFSHMIDPLAAGGLVVADMWGGKRIITIDQLGDEFLETVRTNDYIRISKQGVVDITRTV